MMSAAKRGGRVAPPPPPEGYMLRFASNEAATGWEELCRQAPGNTREAFEAIEQDPCPLRPTSRRHQLKGALSTRYHGGRELPQWQYEVTSGGRIWYLVDEGSRTCWIHYAGTAHPTATD
jgi:hypothetical protein